MNKTLRFMLVSLLTMLCGTVMADSWVKTDPADLQTGDVVVIADLTSATAMSNNNGTSKAPAATAITLNSEKTEITGEVASTLQWVVTVADGTYKFGVADTENFLYTTNSNNGVRVGTNQNNTFILEKGGDSNVDFLKNTATNRYVGVYDNADWRCYTSINANIKETETAFFKKQSGEAPVPAVAKPAFSPAGGTFLGSQEVTLSCETEGAKVYYTLDGNDPTTESTEYAAPFTVTETTTVKAIAAKDGALSSIATATFTAIPSFATLASMAELASNATFGFTGELLVVAKPTDRYVYVKDATGASLIYAYADQTAAVEVGKTIAANWTGKVSIYKELFELVPDAALVMKDGEAVAVEYPEVAAADITAENVNKVVTLKGITTYTVDGKNMTIKVGETEIVGYNQFGLTIAAAEEGKTYKMVGAISRFNDNIQFQPISIEEQEIVKEPIYIETDLTSQFNALTDWTKWTGATGYTATNFCPKVTTNAGQEVQVCEKYEGTCDTTGEIFYQTVTGLTAGTYKIELYGGAAYTFGRGFSSEAFSTGTWNAGDHIDENTGVILYAETSEDKYEKEIPIYYATNFPDGAATVVLEGVVIGENGQVKIGMNKTSKSTNWHVIQLKGVTAQVNAVELHTATLAAAQAALEAEANAVITGSERTALEAAITANTTPAEETAEGYKTVINALNAALTAFNNAKPAYQALADAKTYAATLTFNYAAAAKKEAAEAAAAAVATDADDATAKTTALYQALRQYAESSALAEGVEGAVNMTNKIVNPAAEEALAEPWKTVKGESSGGSINILSGEPWTDGSNNATHKYFDGGDWGANAWDVALQQEITLPAGKYQLTAKMRASGDVEQTLFAGETAKAGQSINATGGLFNRGWNDTSIEFEMAEEGAITIGVRGVTTVQHNWMSFSDFRLVQLEEKAVEVAHTWDFTKWSEETVNNLKAEAAKGLTEGLWSDGEKADGSAATAEISKNNCFWQVGTCATTGETLTANGVEIAELKGLLFKNNKARSLAIAVNYGDCTSANGAGFGPYHGASYLWLGSKEIEYFIIKNVKPGSTIKMGVESHKTTDARGVQLLIGGTVIEGPAAPKTYEDQEWTVPASENATVDVVVKNTNGCHIYYIDAEIDNTITGITTVNTEVKAANGVYNLRGQKVENMVKGQLYIINGKKFMVK